MDQPAEYTAVPVIVLPVINRGDLLKRCLLSIDYPVDDLVVFLNSEDPSLEATVNTLENPFIRKLHVQRRIKYGRGCGPCYNQAIRGFPEAGFWMILGADTFFHPGTLEQMVRYIGHLPEAGAIWFDNTIPVITPVAVRQAGLFDENFYPCYLEDIDYELRLKLSGSPIVRSNIPVGHDSSFYRASASIRSDLNLAFANSVTYDVLKGYYREKWGGDPGHELFESPFNLQGIGVDYWSFDLDLRRKCVWEKLIGEERQDKRDFVWGMSELHVLGLKERLHAVSEQPTEESCAILAEALIAVASLICSLPKESLDEFWSEEVAALVSNAQLALFQTVGAELPIPEKVLDKFKEYRDQLDPHAGAIAVAVLGGF